MDVVILGAGGHGKVVLDILRAAGQHNVVGFLDANRSLAGSTLCDVPVLGGMNLLPKLRQQKRIAAAIVAIGDNRARRSCASVCHEHGVELINAIHPSATVSRTAALGSNVVVAASATICVDARIEDSSIINTGAIVDHETVVGEAAHIAPGAVIAGRVTIGAAAFIGLGAKVIQCLSIGEESIIGAGAVVISDIPARVTAVGIPASVIKTNSTD
jgi:UDP-perosamine 4-acetyltransferase